MGSNSPNRHRAISSCRWRWLEIWRLYPGMRHIVMALFASKGKVGRKLDLSAAQQAAGLALLGCLRSLHDRFETLDAVKRILKLNAYVNCVPNFHELPSVSDAASAILEEVFGENGRHARTTVGVCSLPAGVAVEIELVVQVGIDRSEPKQNARPRSHRRPAQPAAS